MLPSGSSPTFSGAYNVQMSSTSSDEEEGWQGTGKRHKKRKICVQAQSNIATQNRYDSLNVENTSENNIELINIPKPPPIIIEDVKNINKMKFELSSVLSEEQYSTNVYSNNNVRISCNTIESYRKLYNYLKEKKIIHHTYQIKTDRSFRVVLKGLHFSTNIKDISDALNERGHNVRNIINGRQWKTKKPLNLFFVDIEPANNNKDIYNLKLLGNDNITVEPPRKAKGLVQCTRCQQFGHTKTYCNRPYVCVKCGGNHNTTNCEKRRDAPAICFFCNGPHTANYKGCSFYRNLINQDKNKTRNQEPHTNINNNLHKAHKQWSQNRTFEQNDNREQGQSTHQKQNKTFQQNINYEQNSYASALKGDIKLNELMQDMKNMLQQMINQNSMIMNMLTKLISKVN